MPPDPEIQYIPAKNSNKTNPEKKILRVAAYVRVSSRELEQESSLENQSEYFIRNIHENKDWQFVGLYVDDGVSGLNTKKRHGFSKMVEDAYAGKIDLILTKSVSRFARNTVDTIQHVRELKSLGVEVYFEKENISTFTSDGELVLTVMSSIAQEESVSISENTLWGIRNKMKRGEFTLGYSTFLGYKKGEEYPLEIIEAEAKIIRRIYQLYLDGNTIKNIADMLTKEHIPTPTGNNTWTRDTILSILKNEKYMGDALLQKTYTSDFFNKKRSINNNAKTKYYVRNSHPAIIPKETYQKVQEELERRKGWGSGRQSSSPYNRKIICGKCGAFCHHKLRYTNANNCKVYAWACAHCKGVMVLEQKLDYAYVKALKRQRLFNPKEPDQNHIRDKVALLDHVMVNTDGIFIFYFKRGTRSTIRTKSGK